MKRKTAGGVGFQGGRKKDPGAEPRGNHNIRDAETRGVENGSRGKGLPRKSKGRGTRRAVRTVTVRGG